MKKKYYIRYYQTYDKKQTFQQFVDAIASCGVVLKFVLQKQIPGYDDRYFEYVTIWEIDRNADYLLLEDRIDNALKSKHYNNKI